MRKEKNYDTIAEFSRQTEEKGGKVENGMRREKRMAVILGLTLLLGMTGCAGSGAATKKAQGDALAQTGMQEDTGGADHGSAATQEEEGGTDTPAAQEGEWAREEPLPPQETDVADSGAGDAEEPQEKGQAVHTSQGTEHLGGTVQEPKADGMTLAQTTLLDDDGMVTLLEVKDAKKIPVKFTADTRVEHWTIQGGGAGIDMREAAATDLQAGQTVELEGYYDGETFVATKVIMEEYV
ncbi:MAG: hypothetical protein K2N39_01580 [Lachnospiraceae bacterium]|nr:hypothetical protein [Lachnospiraceae bacterium]